MHAKKVLGAPLAALLLAALLPVAYAQSFSVATNKDVYGAGERVIVVGTVPQTTAKTVAIQIEKGGVQCAQQTVAIGRDGSFISRPIKVDCGVGQYTVAASHLDQDTTSTFRVGEQAPDSDDLRQLREELVDARERVNERIRELVGSGTSIPEQAVEKYRAGSVEASLAVQSAEHGDIEQADVHKEAAIGYFDETLALLSPEEVELLSQAGESDEQRAADAADWLDRLGDLYRRLASLAEKNGISDAVFAEIPVLLSDATSALGERDLGAVESALARVEPLLEQARSRLLQSTETAEKQSLTATAERIEKRAEKQLQASNGSPEAQTLVEMALELVGQAKTAINDENYSSARQLLSSASKALIEANRAL
jgi:hypothetical protein